MDSDRGGGCNCNARPAPARPRHASASSAARSYVRDRLLPASVLERAPRREAGDRLLTIVAEMRHADPDLTLAGIAIRLDQVRERTPRGNGKWFPSIVRMLLQRAEKKGTIGRA